MTKRLIISLAITICATTIAFTQEVWSLDKCIRYAIDQSLQVERAEVNEDFAGVNLKQARQARWPSLNLSANGGLNVGRVINPSTNTFETDDSYYNSFGASTGMTIFGGNQINNSIKQANVDLEAAQLDLEQAKLNLALDVALAFLNVLFAEENVTNAKTTLELSQSQLEQIDKLIAAGSRPENERYDILAQIALDQKNLVQLENTIEQNLLVLKQLMRLEPNYELVLERPRFEEDLLARIETYSFESVYESALQTQPQIRAQQRRIESAELGEKLAKGTVLPTLGIGANAGTNYTDLDKFVTQSETTLIPIEGLYINGMEVPIEQEVEIPTAFDTKAYGSQLKDNFGFGVGLDLRIPIYNNYRNKANIDRAKLNTVLERNSDEQIKQALKTEIQNALASAEAASQSLKASQTALDAAEIAYRNSERQYDLGTLNSYDFINARNRLDASRTNLTISKYDYVFRILVIEYYLGRGAQYE